jgi:hypothetical protein
MLAMLPPLAPEPSNSSLPSGFNGREGGWDGRDGSSHGGGSPRGGANGGVGDVGDDGEWKESQSGGAGDLHCGGLSGGNALFRGSQQPNREFGAGEQLTRSSPSSVHPATSPGVGSRFIAGCRPNLPSGVHTLSGGLRTSRYRSLSSLFYCRCIDSRTMSSKMNCSLS